MAAPSLPSKCAKCNRTHTPGQLNSFDKGHVFAYYSSCCDCDDECSDLACTPSCSCDPCQSTRNYWSPHLFWTSPGGLHKHFNSLYTNNEGPRRCREGFTVDYETYTPAELKTFVNQRGIPDPFPEGLTLKYYYVKLLDAADRCPPVFRFMDLPPEMRNRVYLELLTIPEHSQPEFGGYCHPEILSTCREIHNEAADLPYTENTIRLLLHADWRIDPTMPPFFHGGMRHPNKRLFKTVYIQNHGICGANSTDFESIPRGITAWPDFLLRVRKLEIDINLLQKTDDPFDHGSAHFAKNCITTLVAFLMDKNRLDKLSISVDSTGFPYETSNILQPLRRLKMPSGEITSIGGHRPRGKLAELIADMQNPETIYPNIIKDTQSVFHNAARVLLDNPLLGTPHFTGQQPPILAKATWAMVTCSRGVLKRVLQSEAAYSTVYDTYIAKRLEDMRKLLGELEEYL